MGRARSGLTPLRVRWAGAAAAAARVVYYSLDPGGFYQEFDPWLDRLLKYIFYPFIFTAYTMVLYFWYGARAVAARTAPARASPSSVCGSVTREARRASSYYRKNHGRLEAMRRLRLIFVGFIVAMYLVELAFTTLQYAFEDEERFSREQVTLWYQLYLAAILLFISSAFLYYGYRIYTQLRAVALHANAGLRSLRQVGRPGRSAPPLAPFQPRLTPAAPPSAGGGRAHAGDDLDGADGAVLHRGHPLQPDHLAARHALPHVVHRLRRRRPGPLAGLGRPHPQ